MQHLYFDCSVPTLGLQRGKKTRIQYPQTKWKLSNISHLKAGTQSIVCELITGCPVCVTSFVPPVPSSAFVRRASFFLCGLEVNQNAW